MFEDTSFRSEHLGVITHGSLNDGIEMKLDPGESVEDVRAGTFVVIQGEKHDFFCMITDVEIEAAN
ncbi:MAG: ATPase, partial [Bacteroidetes bacterium QS_1_63_11]